GGVFATDNGQLTTDQPYIIKAVWEHASFGLGDDAVVPEGDPHPVPDRLRAWAARHGRPCFAEQYIPGREFNLSLLGGESEPPRKDEGGRMKAETRQETPSGSSFILHPSSFPEVLPPAEIDFSAFPAGKPHLVGYRAKWDADSFEYHHTPRRF